jgi:hypothetical protein
MSEAVLSSLMEEFKGAREDLIPILQRAQELDGYLRPGTLSRISRWLRISENEIFGVATFYAQFRFPLASSLALDPARSIPLSAGRQEEEGYHDGWQQRRLFFITTSHGTPSVSRSGDPCG